MQMILYGCYCSQDTRVWNWTKIKTFQKVKIASVDSLCNLLPWYLKRSDLAHMVSEIKEVRGPKGGHHECMQSFLERSHKCVVTLTVSMIWSSKTDQTKRPNFSSSF
jgi:hypothetical protein